MTPMALTMQATAGKITAPVAKAMARLDRARRQRLWDIVRSKPADRAEIGMEAGALHLLSGAFVGL